MEVWDLFDENRIKTNKIAVRKEKIPQGLYHMTVHVVLFNSEGKMLIQQRASEKNNWRDLWDLTAGGCAISGETSKQAVHRELFEELGIEYDFANIMPRISINYDDGFGDYYIIKDEININSLNFQKSEVQGAKWANLDEILSMLEEGKFVPYQPNFIKLLYDLSFLKSYTILQEECL